MNKLLSFFGFKDLISEKQNAALNEMKQDLYPTYTNQRPDYTPIEVESSYPWYQRIVDIRERAETNGWQEIDFQEQNRMISFVRAGMRINVYYSKMTVGTCVDHPSKGKTQLFRRNVSLSFLTKIFKNPRVHTSKSDEHHGYRLRKDK